MERDPRQSIDNGPLSIAQMVAIAVLVGLNALDGFDVLSISFASPGIAHEWGIDKAALGLVLSMELIGMAIGSLFIGGVSDKFGRRPVMLACLVAMAGGMLLATTAQNVQTLSLWRILTGVGVGGMLATTNAATAEIPNSKYRNLALAMMVIGYPIGGVVGGSVAKVLLAHGDWRPIFAFGGIATLVFVPLTWAFVPETVAFLCQRQPPNALARINATLRRFRLDAVNALPTRTVVEQRASLSDLFAPSFLATTVFVTIAYSAHIISFYFILKWIPKIVVDMGFAPTAAAGVLVWANVGGASGGALLGLLTRHFALKTLTIGALLGSTLLLIIFGQSYASLAQLSLISACVGFFTNAGVVGLYATFAHAFPTHIRATGTGFAIGIGRGASALAPMIAGSLFRFGYSLQLVAIIMSMGSLIALLSLTRLTLSPPNADN